MDYDEHGAAFMTKPVPEPRYRFTGSFGAALYFADFNAASAYYRTVLGKPAYVEGKGTLGWRIGKGWLTLLEGGTGAPSNIEVILEVASAHEAEELHRSFIEAGGNGPEPSDQLMYRPVKYCAVRDPFGTQLLITAPLETEDP
jgi:hypothetical protein